jgi:hypothetical protein
MSASATPEEELVRETPGRGCGRRGQATSCLSTSLVDAAVLADSEVSLQTTDDQPHPHASWGG